MRKRFVPVHTRWQQGIQNDIDHALISEGLSVVPAEGDASVSAFGATKEVPGEATTSDEVTPEGTPVVDIFDTSSKKLIWRSPAADTLIGNRAKPQG